MELSRREFLKLLGVTTASAAVGAFGASTIFSVPDEVFERVVTGPRIETWKNSICSLCPAGCGIRVRLIDGIPVRVLGNPLYPINRGAVCPMAEAGVEELFHPDRIRQPLKRVGIRGENQWKPISWEEALQTLGDRLKTLRDTGKPEKLAIVTKDHHELVNEFASRFMTAFGSPNFISSNNGNMFTLPVRLSQGLDRPPAYDFTNTRYVLNFGADLLDDGPSPIRYNQLYSALRSRKDGMKGKIIHISSYMSRTAINSTEWIPIKPGTMAALALGIAYILIKDKSYDKNLIEKHAFGFSDWQDGRGKAHKGFRAIVMEEYYPEKVSQLTGIPARKIIEIARDFAAAKSALAIGGGQAAAATNSLYTLWAIYALNALKGNFEKPGGVLFPKDGIAPLMQDLKLDSVAKKGLKKQKVGTDSTQPNLLLAGDFAEQLLPALQENHPYGIDTLIFYRANPLFETTLQKKYAAALQKTPFIVSCSSFMNETTAYADLILPDHVFLEKWEVSRNIPTVEFSHFGVQQPVIKPLYDTRHFGDILLQLARNLGGSVASSLPWENYVGYLKARAQSLYSSGQGTIISESVRFSWIEFLKKRGWQVFEYSTFDEFWQVLLEKGGWWDPSYPKPQPRRIFKTKSKKFEFYSQTLQGRINKWVKANGLNARQVEGLYRRWKVTAHGDLIFLPHYENPRFNPENIDFPYHLISFSLLTNRNGHGGHLALLQELSGLHSREYWNSWAELNPETAAKFGIHEDDYISIISSKGQVYAKVKIRPTVMPEVIMLPTGFGHEPFGRFKKSYGVNPYKIFSEDLDLLSGIPSLISTKVRIEKVKPEEVS